MLLAFALTGPTVGCQTLQPSTPLTVQVRDAETQAPVPSATVRLWRFGTHAADRDQSFTTASDGNALAHLGPPDDNGVMVEVIGPGHLSTQKAVPNDVVQALASATFFHPYKGPPLAVTVEVYAGPRPTAELVVPDGFRGLIKADVRVLPNGSWPPGQRTFTYTVPSSGAVDVSGPPLFALGAGPEIVARFASGAPLPKDPPKGEEVGFRWLRHEGSVMYYVVGTAADFAEARSHMPRNDSGYGDGSSKRGGGGRGGSGGGGGGGGMGGGGMGGRGLGGGMGGRGMGGGMSGGGMGGP
jgi:hypothetical protein